MAPKSKLLPKMQNPKAAANQHARKLLSGQMARAGQKSLLRRGGAMR